MRFRYFISGKCESAGTEHPSTLTSMNNLAMVLRDQGKYEQAEEMFRQALRLRETVLGKKHPDILTSMYNLAYVLSNRKRFSEANALYQRALNSYGKNLTPDHPTVPVESHGCRPKPARAIPVQGLRHLTAATLF